MCLFQEKGIGLDITNHFVNKKLDYNMENIVKSFINGKTTLFSSLIMILC